MPVDKQVLLRYQVLNDCFRNPYREYGIDDLVDACSEAMRRKNRWLRTSISRLVAGLGLQFAGCTIVC